MIKFFRKIRQKLLSEGKNGKYLKYAIGEILLVIIGILIALQINNWNEWEKDRKKEQKILIQIENNVEESIAIWERAVEIMELSNNHYQIVLAAKNNNYTHSDSLQRHFKRAHWIGYNWTTGHSTASFEALKNKGFDIITNDYLSNLIIDVFEKNILRVQNDFSRDMFAKDNNYEQYMTKYVHGLVNEFNSANYNTLIKDDYYYSILHQINGWRLGHLRRLNELHIPEMQRTLSLIKQELKK
tara:strand:+ start:123 stop:848 length:726 start_codon:yes stop_codon:yes gene_type:complete